MVIPFFNKNSRERVYVELHACHEDKHKPCLLTFNKTIGQNKDFKSV